MMNKLLELLKNKPDVDQYLVRAVETESTELFFIGSELQMNRGKNVSHIEVTVYRNYELDGKKYKGSSVARLSPLMDIEEMDAKIEAASLAAASVRNEYYNLVSPDQNQAPELESKFFEGDAIDHIAAMVKDLFSVDTQLGSFINSVEFFLNKSRIRLINSEGLDVAFDKVSGTIELITEAKDKQEAIELYEFLEFSDYDSEWIRETVRESLYKAHLRLKAVPLPKLDDIPIILTGEAVHEFFAYFRAKASGKMAYEGISTEKPGDLVQTKEATGDRVTMSLVPYLKNSAENTYYDSDGVLLKDVDIIADGVLLGYATSKRYADYLGIEPTGEMANIVVKGGKMTLAELKQTPYLELLNFSDFQMDAMTGDFAGEIRLGIYNDGTKEIPVTLGSISGNIKNVEKDMFFSKELQQKNNFSGPEIILLHHVAVAGN